MQRRLLGWCGWLLALMPVLAFGPSPALAQVRWELEPAVGVYTGFGSFTRPRNPDAFDLDEDLAQRTTVALAAQATAWFSPHVGGRLLLFTSASAVGPASHDPLNREAVPARVTVAALEALAPLGSSATNRRIFLAAGANLIHRGGKAYDGFEGTTDLGGSLGLGSQFQLAARTSLQMDLRAVMYQLRLTDPNGLQYSSSFQTDLLAHVGLMVRLAPAMDE